MIVSLKELKYHLSRAKGAVQTGPIDSATEYIMIKATTQGLRIGGRGSALSYVGSIVPLVGTPEPFTVYIPITAVASLSLPKTKEDTIELQLVEGDLHFGTNDAKGIVKTVQGMAYCSPYQQVEGEPYLILASGTALAKAIKFVAEVGKGWTKALIPTTGEFVQLQVTDDICSLAVAPTTADQERAMGVASGTALSVFASDGGRYYQTFEPIYHRPETERGDSVPVTTLITQAPVAPLHLAKDVAIALGKVLPDEQVRVHVLYDEIQRVKAVILFNSSTFIWVRIALNNYPDEDMDNELKYFIGEEVATFTPTPAFKKTVTAAVKVPGTGDHGLTFQIEDGMIRITSPEDGAVVRYGTTPAETIYPDTFTTVVSGEGVKSALTKMKGPITVVLGSDFLVLNNLETKSRIVLRVYEQE